jgi:hypothetical protein
MRNITVVIVFVALSATQVHAKDKDVFASMGHGTATCGQFGRDYAEIPAIEESYFYWAQGYMSGLNEQVGADPQPNAET